MFCPHATWLVLIAVAALSAPCAALEFGICPPTYYPGQDVLFTESVAADLEKLGCDCFRLPFYDEHGTVNLAAFDEIVARACAHNFKILGLVVLDPTDWNRESPEFLQAFVDRCALLSARYGESVWAWELWNEPDQSAVYISPDSFGRIIAAAYDAIKANDPDSIVMPGGLAWPIPYLNQFYESPAVAAYRSARGHYPFDAVAVHPYDWSGDPRYYLAQWLARVRLVLTSHGDTGKPFWITEIGWNTAAGQPDSVGNDASPCGWNDQAQALHVRNLFSTAKAIPDVHAVFCYALNDYALPDSLGWFGLRRYDQAPKPGWFAYRAAALGTPGPAQIANGGFESGDLSDWAVLGTVDGVTGGPWFAGITARSGRYFLGSAVNLGGPSGGKNGCVMQSLSVEPEAVYELSAVAWTYQEGGIDADAAVRVGIDPAGGTDPYALSVIWSPWTWSVGGWTPVSVECAALGQSITCFVQFRQTAPIWDVTAVDDVMLRERVRGSPGVLKCLPDGTLVSLDAVVTAAGLEGPSFYAESVDRCSGIRIVSDAPVVPGDLFSLKGRMGRFGSERAIFADSFNVVGGSGTAAGYVAPLGMSCRSIGGGDVYGADGVWVAQRGAGPHGADNTGLLVAIAGRVLSVESDGSVYIDDGSTERSSSQTQPRGLLTVGCAGVKEGDFVRIEGVVSRRDDGYGPRPLLLATRVSNVPED